MGLVPAMTVKCAVALVKSIRAGEGVSYGHTWIAERDTTVALMPIGYADGVFRSLGGRLDVLINGRRRPGVGRVCMDQFLVDLGPGQIDVAAGDEAILFRPGSRGASPGPIARPDPLSDEKTRRRHRERAWLAGGAGLTAVATIVGASARRSMI